METFCPQMPAPLNQSCVSSKSNFWSSQHESSHTIVYILLHVLSLRVLSSNPLGEQVSLFLPCILLLSSGSPTAVLIALHILALIVFSSFFLHLFSWLNCENGLDKVKNEVSTSGKLRRTKDIKCSNGRVRHLCPPVHPNSYKPQILLELCLSFFPGSKG